MTASAKVRARRRAFVARCVEGGLSELSAHRLERTLRRLAKAVAATGDCRGFAPGLSAAVQEAVRP